MITQDELAGIIIRVAMADDAALALILDAAHQAEAGLLPNDLEKLSYWAKFIRTLRAATAVELAQE
jgi:hypothetical protein